MGPSGVGPRGDGSRQLSDGSTDAGYHGDFFALGADQQALAATVVGSPAAITAHATLSSMPAWTAWREQLAAIVARSTERTLPGRLAAWDAAVSSEDAVQDSEIAGSIYEAGMQANMAGQLFIREVEAPEVGHEVTQPIALAPHALTQRALDSGIPVSSPDRTAQNPFARLPFDEALRLFLARGIVTPEEFRAMSDEARARSFTATRFGSAELIRRCQAHLASTLASGGRYADFARGIQDETLTLGIEAQSPAYLETVYRTNVGAAYGSGRLQQITSPAVVAARPYVEYRTAGDSRVRPTHAAMRGVVFSATDPEWPKYMPPNGFSCRCTVVTRRASEVNPAKVTSAASLAQLQVEVGRDANGDAVMADIAPDAGFNAPPTLGDAT